MNIVDLLLVVMIAAAVLHGLYVGAAVQLATFAGLWGGLLAGAILYWSPVRNLIELPVTDHRSAAQMALDAERDQPVGA